MAIANILDEACAKAQASRQTLIVFWDFSNAFCTTIHSIAMDIAQKYNLSSRMTKLLSEFMKQSSSMIKISDNTGYYKSEISTTNRGGHQVQIGSDFLFALIDDRIDPKSLFCEIIERTKYVDDFTDVISGDSPEIIFKSVGYNTRLGLSVGDNTHLQE